MDLLWNMVNSFIQGIKLTVSENVTNNIILNALNYIILPILVNKECTVYLLKKKIPEFSKMELRAVSK